MQPQSPTLAGTPSLPEVHGSVSTSGAGWFRRLLAFAGPAYLVSVGYMDPGNWVTDLEGGARFGYQLLWVLVVSNAMALLLQTLSARLGIVTGRDLAQACREEYPLPVAYVLWILCELAIIACDLAEVVGAAIGLNLLFHIPVLIGVVLTAADTLLILWFSRYGIRAIEACVVVLISTIGGCFLYEIFLAKPEPAAVLHGLIPHLNSQNLYIAVAILGATVMPHNLYLHSALVQTRQIGETVAERRTACRYNLFDSVLALNAALLVNAAILVLAAAVFFRHGIVVTEIQQAHSLLSPILGTTAASIVFGLALLCSGQSSTLTGTMAGQIVMEGFIHFKMQPWLRRSITRVLAITPAVFTIWIAGETGLYKLLIFSQVILCLQLPFAVVPLVQITGKRQRMGEFANNALVQTVAWTTAATIIALNAYLAWSTVAEANSGPGSTWKHVGGTLLVVLTVFLLGLLALLIFWPVLGRRAEQKRVAVRVDAEAAASPLPPRNYASVLVPLDHTGADAEALANAVAIARSNGARMVLLHVEHDVTSMMFGALASTAEVKEGQQYLDHIAGKLRQDGIQVDVIIRHGSNIVGQIEKVANELQPDLLIMAAHGHRGLKDLIFGSTINSVRHRLKMPVLIVQGRS